MVKRKTSLDTNAKIAALLRDLAAVQQSPQSAWGYKRAASTIRDLTVPIEELVAPNGSLPKIPNIGPKTEPIILEVLRTGRSATVEKAIAESGLQPDVEEKRQYRENFLSRAQVLRALKNRKLSGPTLEDYRGDLQMHSVWSDGTQTIEQIAETCFERGYEYCAVTDHSYGLRIARGVSMADLARQHQQIDRINKRYRGRFRVLKGIEANILADGTVDMTRAELQRLEVVVAAPHSVLRSTKDQTHRMVSAMRTPGIHILGHPRGRMYGTRPGVNAQWSEVFAAAARFNVAVEIDGDPSRQDIDFTLARDAHAAGCFIALDSDAHMTAELANAETAIAHARLAGIPKERVINCWPLEQLEEWLASR